MPSYYLAVLVVSLANLALATVAYHQRARQIRGNAVRERQLGLAEARNRLAETRLRRLDDELSILTEIRDAVRATQPRPVVGVIDIGSATARLVVCRYDARSASFVRLCKRGAYLGLGAEVERNGEYGQALLADLRDRLGTLSGAAERAGCERLAVVVTAPGRSGRNTGALLHAIAAATAREPCVLSPEDEAQLAFAGATMSPAAAIASSAFVCDVGGGSTEVALGSPKDGVTASASFEIGAFRLAERHFHHEPPTPAELRAARAEAKEIVRLDVEPSARIALATGGTARAVAKLAGRVVAKHELATALTKAVSGIRVAKHPERQRSLPAGIAILEALHSATELPLTIARGGLREGVLLQLSGLRPTPLGEPAERLAR